MEKTEFIRCPVCGNKTRDKIREDTILKNFPLFCPKCKSYELMGMEVKTVRNLFLVENSMIGGAAFLLGLLLGTGLSGLLNQVVQNIFEVPHHYQVLFSPCVGDDPFLFSS